MAKHNYRCITIQKINVAELAESVRGAEVVVGIDVAKHRFVAVISTERRDLNFFVSWEAPTSTRAFVELVLALKDTSSKLSVAMEPTGTYGDPLRALLLCEDVPVYRVSPKRVHDASEDFDGVPSSHDPKAAAIVAQQHWDGKSHLRR